MQLLKKLVSLWTVLELTLACLIIHAGASFASDKHQSFDFKEGQVSTAVVTAGPFDLHRRYRSMEGPYISFNFRPGDIVASKEISLPEGLVSFVEGNAGPSMMGGAASQQMTQDVKGLIDTSTQPRTLLWLKGVKEEVLDENDKPLPTAEFICHWNLDVNPSFRNQIFPGASKCATTRIVTITQGQTEITFPDGYGVPVASDEPWNCVFQAANRTTDDHRRIKHRCTFYFIKDSDLVYPITALNWYVPWIYVVIDKNSPQAAVAEKSNCPSCLGLMTGVNAPNNTANGTFNDSKGRLLSGHWVIPTGKHTYTATINDEMEPGFNSKPRTIHAVWSHVHPLCTDISLYKCEGGAREKVFSTSAKTRTAHGLEIERIKYWSSKKGFTLPEKVNYEMQVSYNNTTNTPQDSMATAGIFFEDSTFARPDWVLHAKEGYACSMTKACIASAGSSNSKAAEANASEMAATVSSSAVSTADTANTTGTNIVRTTTDTDSTTNISAVSTATDPASATANATNAGSLPSNTESVPASILAMPMFDKSLDGPLLSEAKMIELQTNAGQLSCYIDPAMAPVTATHMYKLFSSGAFVGTRIYKLEPDYMLQVANVEDKADGQKPLSAQSQQILRRIPLEVSQQSVGKLSHHKYVLCMARYTSSADSATSSFFILLKDSPHLDQQFTIFGQLEEDPATLNTLTNIEKNWDPNKYWIVGSKAVNKMISISNH